MDSLVNVLKEEEYNWFLKHQEILRYSNKENFATLRKRKAADISKDYHSPEKQNESSKSLKEKASPYLESSNLKRMKSNTESARFKATPLKIELNGSTEADCVSNNLHEWLKWNSYSCRLDAFFTIIIFAILDDANFSFDLLKTRANRKLKETLHKIKIEENISGVQKQVDDFAKYRQFKFGEEIGRLHSIIPLFTQFEEINEFQFKINDFKSCKCGKTSSRSFTFGPLLSITTKNLEDVKGDVESAIKAKLGTYFNECLDCRIVSKTERSVQQHPKFFLILLEICEEFTTLKSRRSFKKFKFLSLTSSFLIKKFKYELASICYFQNHHFTAHVQNVINAKLNINSNKWNYHDGCVMNGQLVELEPNLKFEMYESLLLPYVLLYKLK